VSDAFCIGIFERVDKAKNVGIQTIAHHEYLDCWHSCDMFAATSADSLNSIVVYGCPLGADSGSGSFSAAQWQC
jgi:hypothetical protein